MRWPFSKKAKPKPHPIAIPMPEGIDPTAFDRVPMKLRRADPAAAAQGMREKNGKLFLFNRERAGLAGATHYRWRTAGDSDVCEVCAKRNGKKFAYHQAPPQGHAGICTACPQGFCRCYAEPIIPG